MPQERERLIAMPSAFSYENSLVPAFPGWLAGEPALSSSTLRGLAYDAGSHFVHFYQQSDEWWVVSPGLTATQANDGSTTIEAWIQNNFGSRSRIDQARPAGEVTEWVWRPGLTYIDQIRQALDVNDALQRRAEQSLHLLMQRLTEILLFIEPEGAGLDSYSLKSRELLIMAATDVEDVWAQYLKKAKVAPGRQGYSTNDFVKLAGPLHLEDYEISFTPYSGVEPSRPFHGWDSNRPTQSLPWYDAYNKVKHDKTGSLYLATIGKCFEAVAANIAMYCVRFSPYPLFIASTPVASLVQHLVKLRLVSPDPKSFYTPLLDCTNFNSELQLFNSQTFIQDWSASPLGTAI